MVALRQSTQTVADAFSPPALASGALPGSLLLSAFGRNDFGPDPTVSTAGWALAGGQPQVHAHPGFGGFGSLWFKIATGGETTVTWTPQQGKIILAELTGIGPGGLIAAARSAVVGQAGAAFSQASGNPARPALIAAVLVNRLNNTLNGDVAPTAPINRIPVANPLPGAGGNNLPCILWSESQGGALTMSGTQAGDTQDGFHWGMMISGWALLEAAGFAGEPGGGIW